MQASVLNRRTAYACSSRGSRLASNTSCEITGHSSTDFEKGQTRDVAQVYIAPRLMKSIATTARCIIAPRWLSRPGSSQ
eukprot:6177673-Pleurochrysis_carterae.AAC.1